MNVSEQLRRARDRLAKGWNPNACYAERRATPDSWNTDPFESCEPTDELAERFSILGALQADGESTADAVKLLCLLQSLPVVRLAATLGLEPQLLAAGLGAWECQPERTNTEVQQLLSTAVARAMAIERGRGNR